MKISGIAMAAVLALHAAAVAAAGNDQPRWQNSQAASASRPAFHGRPGGAQSAQAPAAGMPSFYQPSYSIDRKDWWQPHPYFQSNGQGYGYPSHPGPHTHYRHHGHRR